MYLKNTPEFDLLKKLYRSYKGQRDDISSLGIASHKFGAPASAIAQLKLDGYLSEIQRERWVALWITPLGLADYEAFKLSDVPPPPPPDPEGDRVRELKAKLLGGTITETERSELINLALKRLFF